VATPAGVKPTRFSLFLISFGVPIFISYNFRLKFERVKLAYLNQKSKQKKEKNDQKKCCKTSIAHDSNTKILFLESK
jgi:hypothetical protein